MTNSPIPICEKIYNEKSEKQISCEVALPEYCPGIERIILFDSKPHISNCSFDGQKIYVSGSCLFSVLYKSDYKEKIKFVSFNQDFSHSFEASSLSKYQQDNLHIESKAINVTCNVTPINGRRLSLNSKLVIFVCADVCSTLPLYTDFGADCQTLNNTVVCLQRMFLPDVSFSISEQITLESQMPPAAEIIFSNSLVRTDQIKCHDGQAEISGTISLYCLYEAENDSSDQSVQYIALQKDIPFSHTVHTGDFDTPFELKHSISVTDTKCEILPDSYGENRSINSIADIEIKNIELAGNKNYDVCCDAFSTCFESSAVTTPFTCTSVGETIHTTVICEENVKCDSCPITEVMLATVQIDLPTCEVLDTKLCFGAKANISIIGTNAEGEIFSANVSCPVHITLPAGEYSTDTIFSPYIQAGEISCKMQNGVLNTVMKLCLWCAVENQSSFYAVNDFKISNDNPLPSNCDVITVYYPESNETLWEIAKKYAVSPEKITEANNSDLTSEAIIIPCRE